MNSVLLGTLFQAKPLEYILLPMLRHITLLLFGRGFYSKDLITTLNNRKINYLIFVPQNPQEKDEFSSMYQTERKVIPYEFSMYRDGRKVCDFFYLAFLKQMFDHRPNNDIKKPCRNLEGGIVP